MTSQFVLVLTSQMTVSIESEKKNHKTRLSSLWILILTQVWWYVLFQGLDCEPYKFEVAAKSNLQVFDGEEYKGANTREECEKRCLWLSKVQEDVCAHIFS